MSVPTPDQLAMMIAQDPTPMVDGCTNIERVAFILDVFGVDTIELASEFDYSIVRNSDDLIYVQATLHLAKLQLQFWTACQYAGHIAAEDVEGKIALLQLSIYKMTWHQSYLSRGLPTPPYSFVN